MDKCGNNAKEAVLIRVHRRFQRLYRSLRDPAKGGLESSVTREELIAILRGRQGQHADQAVVISADKNVRYEEVINVMDMLQQQHIQKVGLLTQAKK